jgi:hypothetical protein
MENSPSWKAGRSCYSGSSCYWHNHCQCHETQGVQSRGPSAVCCMRTKCSAVAPHNRRLLATLLIDYDEVRDYVSELRPPTELLFIPRVICEHGEPRWWWWLRITPESSTRALWQSYQQRHLEKVGGMDEGVRILPISIWNTSRELLTCRKILWHVTSGFTSHPKESVLRIFIALKNPSSQPGLNTRPFGPVATTLATKPPRRLNGSILPTLIVSLLSSLNAVKGILVPFDHWITTPLASSFST